MRVKIGDLEVGDECTMYCGCRVSVTREVHDAFGERRCGVTLVSMRPNCSLHMLISTGGPCHLPKASIMVDVDPFVLELRRSFS